MPSLTALFVGLGSIGTRHLNNLAARWAHPGRARRAAAVRRAPAPPRRPEPLEPRAAPPCLFTRSPAPRRMAARRAA